MKNRIKNISILEDGLKDIGLVQKAVNESFKNQNVGIFCLKATELPLQNDSNCYF